MSSEIEDSNGKPLFKVTADDDPDVTYFGDSPSKCWTQILRAIGAKTNSKRATFSISGANQFGLNNHTIRKIIANLPVESNANEKRKSTSDSEKPQKKQRLEKDKSSQESITTSENDTAPGNDSDVNASSILSQTVDMRNEDQFAGDALVTKLQNRWNSVKKLLQTESYVTSTLEQETTLESANISSYARIRSEIPYISVDEMKEGLKEYQDVDELMDMLETHKFLKRIRRRVAEATGGIVETRKARQKKIQLTVSYDADTDQPKNATPKHDKKKHAKKTAGTLYERKKRASTKEKTDPNMYYFYFLPDDETQKLGAWSKEERKMFVARMKEFDMNTPKWGLFSLGIPGRTGKQCTSHYSNGFKSNEGIDFESTRKRAKNVEPVPPKKIIFEDSDSDGLECVVLISE